MLRQTRGCSVGDNLSVLRKSHNALIVVISALMFISSCASNTELKNQLRACEAERQHLEEQRNKFEKIAEGSDQQYQQMQRQYLDKWGELNEEINQLKKYRQEYNRLLSSHENLELQHSRYEDWSDALMDNFGPGIYEGSTYDWPVFKKKPEDPTIEGIIQELNSLFRESDRPQLILQEFEDSTVHVTVDNEDKLTRRMGSSGARMYILSVVYSLSSIAEVRCVQFNISEGDHTGPGKHCR